jgi:hypothetical protein
MAEKDSEKVPLSAVSTAGVRSGHRQLSQLKSLQGGAIPRLGLPGAGGKQVVDPLSSGWTARAAAPSSWLPLSAA